MYASGCRRREPWPHNAIIFFLPSIQDNLQQCRKAGTFQCFEQRSGSDVIILFLPSVKVNLQQCYQIVLAISTGQFAVQDNLQQCRKADISPGAFATMT